jgi:alpha-ketoglutarate-dependent taurine dioxygenase
MTNTVTKLEPFGALIEPGNGPTHVKNLDLGALRELFDQHHILLLRGFTGIGEADDLVDFSERWGEVAVWPFGKVLELVEQEQPKDHIFDHTYVPMHWDGMYRPEVPEIQIFHCVQAPGKQEGGRTVFSNTPEVIRLASQEDREKWAKVTGVYERKMEFYHSKTVAPLLDEHPIKKIPVLRYCEPPMQEDEGFLNHPEMSFEGIDDDLGGFLKAFQRQLYAEEVIYAHQWETGDIVVSDNYTLLHGREAFSSGAGRHLRRVQVLGHPKLANPHLVFHS